MEISSYTYVHRENIQRNIQREIDTEREIYIEIDRYIPRKTKGETN
jgi:hypothetical protein